MAAVGLFALRQLAPIVFWLLGVLSPFLVALVLAYVFDPVVTFVQRKLKLGRTAGILVLALSMIAVLGGVMVWLLPVLYEQLTSLIEQIRTRAPELIDRFLTNHVPPETIALWKDDLRDNLGRIDELVRQAFVERNASLQPLAQGSLATASNVAGGILRGLGQVGGWLAGGLLILIVTFYYLTDMDKIPTIIRKMLPEDRREKIWAILVEADRAVGGFLRGQLTACACVAALVSILLFAVGMKQYALLIGCFAGAMNFIPYLGPVAGATPAILWALFTDQFDGLNERGFTILMLVGVFVLVQVVDGLLLQPFIVGKHASLHPLAVIFALAVGSQAGVGGMIIAVPAACIAKVVWIELYWKKRTDFLAPPSRGKPPAGKQPPPSPPTQREAP
jgi:predicted PurR-regulated permease PerM